MSKRPHLLDYTSPNIVIVPTVSFCCGPPKKPKLGEHSHLPLPKTRIPKKCDTPTLEQNVMTQACDSSNNSVQVTQTTQKVCENVLTSNGSCTQPKSGDGQIKKCSVDETLNRNRNSVNTSWASNFLMSIGEPKKEIRVNLSMSRKKGFSPKQYAYLPTNTSIAPSNYVTKSANVTSKILSNSKENKVLYSNSSLEDKTCQCNNKDAPSFLKITEKNVNSAEYDLRKVNSKSETQIKDIRRKQDKSSICDLKNTPTKPTKDQKSKINYDKNGKTKLKQFDNIERKIYSKDKGIVNSDSKLVAGKLCESDTTNRKNKNECKSTVHKITKPVSETMPDTKHRTIDSKITKSHNSSYSKRDKLNYSDNLKIKKDKINKNIKENKDKFAKIPEEVHHKESKDKTAKNPKDIKKDKITTRRSRDETKQKVEHYKKSNKAEINSSKLAVNSAIDSKSIFDKHLEESILPIKSIVQVTDGFEMKSSPDYTTKPKIIDLRSKLSRCNYLKHIKNYKDISRKDKKLAEEERENLIITIENNKDEENLKLKDDGAPCIKKKTKHLKYKKIKLVINVICEKSGSSSSDCEDSEEEKNHTCSSKTEDLSFLDDLNIDEIVESLKQSGNNIDCIDLTLLSDDDGSPDSTLELKEISPDEIKKEPIEIIEISDEVDPITHLEDNIRCSMDTDESSIRKSTNFISGKTLLSVRDIKVEKDDDSQSFSTEGAICKTEIKNEKIDDNIPYVKGTNDASESIVHPKQKHISILEATNDNLENKANDSLIVGSINIKKEPDEIEKTTNNDITNSNANSPFVDSEVDYHTTKNVSAKEAPQRINVNINIIASSEITLLKTDPLIKNDSEVMPIKETVMNETSISKITNIGVKKTASCIEVNTMEIIEDPKSKNTTKLVTKKLLPTGDLAVDESEEMYDNYIKMEVDAGTLVNNKCAHEINLATSKLQDSKADDATSANIVSATASSVISEKNNSTMSEVALDSYTETSIETSAKDREVETQRDQSGPETNKPFNKILSVATLSVTTQKNHISDKIFEEKKKEEKRIENNKTADENSLEPFPKTNDVSVKTDMKEENKNVEICPLNSKEGDETASLVTIKDLLKKVEMNTLNNTDLILVKQLEDRMIKYFNGDYSVTSMIRDGKFSQIFLCKDSEGRNFVTKLMKTTSKNGYLKEKMLMKLQCGIPKQNLHFVFLINGFSLNKKWCLFMEYYPFNLAQVLNDRKESFHISTVQDFSKQLVTAVTVLRHNNVVHSDIKPSHILVNGSTDKIKLCGFDSAYYINSAKISPYIGTAQYRAPEIILGHSAGYSIDVWATALVMYEMVTRHTLFYGSHNNDVLYKQLHTFGPVPPDMLNKSLFKNWYFAGDTFVRRNGWRMQGFIFKKNPNILISSIHRAYFRDWNSCEGKKQEMAKLFQFNRLLEQMLTIHPNHRLAIEFVYCNPFIF